MRYRYRLTRGSAGESPRYVCDEGAKRERGILHDEEMKKRLRYDWKIAAGVCQGVELDVTVD